MQRLTTKTMGSYWLTQEETAGIRKMLAKGVPFITLSRYDLTINSFEVLTLGTPDFLLPAARRGERVTFLGETPVIEKDGYYMEYDDGWHRIEGKLVGTLDLPESAGGRIMRIE